MITAAGFGICKASSACCIDLPEVIAAQTIFVAEGEKDADNLRALGFTATTNPLGAEKWRDEYSETLRGQDRAHLW